jgi:nitroreductase
VPKEKTVNVTEAISNRRSIRKFLDKDISKDIIENILKSGINAPSQKNIQPWKFIVVTHESKRELIETIETGFENIKENFGLLLDEINFLSSAENTIKIMKEAPVIILVLNTESKAHERQTPVRKYVAMANIQSIGACIENMLLASLEYGIGSLWISDIYYTASEIGEWLKTDRQIIAAVALGYPAENPPPRARKDLKLSVEWKGAWPK